MSLIPRRKPKTDDLDSIVLQTATDQQKKAEQVSSSILKRAADTAWSLISNKKS